MTDKKKEDYQLDFYAFQQSGGDLCSDVELKEPITKLHELEKGFVAYCMGPAGDVRKVLITEVTRLHWSGDSGGLVVSGSFQPDRFMPGDGEGLSRSSEGGFEIKGKGSGGWAAESFGDTTRLAGAVF